MAVAAGAVTGHERCDVQTQFTSPGRVGEAADLAGGVATCHDFYSLSSLSCSMITPAGGRRRFASTGLRQCGDGA